MASKSSLGILQGLSNLLSGLAPGMLAGQRRSDRKERQAKMDKQSETLAGYAKERERRAQTRFEERDQGEPSDLFGHLEGVRKKTGTDLRKSFDPNYTGTKGSMGRQLESFDTEIPKSQQEAKTLQGTIDQDLDTGSEKSDLKALLKAIENMQGQQQGLKSYQGAGFPGAPDTDPRLANPDYQKFLSPHLQEGLPEGQPPGGQGGPGGPGPGGPGDMPLGAQAALEAMQLPQGEDVLPQDKMAAGQFAHQAMLAMDPNQPQELQDMAWVKLFELMGIPIPMQVQQKMGGVGMPGEALLGGAPSMGGPPGMGGAGGLPG